jgi:hypothetical protein
MLEILHDEIDRTLALIGRPGVASLDASAVCERPSRGPMVPEPGRQVTTWSSIRS